MKDYLIKLQQVSIGYGAPLLVGLDLTIRAGEFWGVVGPNGAGKTTLVKTILGLLRPLAGNVSLRSQQLRFGYVPQRHTLNADYPLTTLDVAVMGRFSSGKMIRRLSRLDRDRAMEELTRLGMEGQAGMRYSSLSGGQQQRVLMARALAADPEVLILDEPASEMDLRGEADIHSFLVELQRTSNIAVLMISHHLGTVVSHVDHLCIVNKDTDLFRAGDVEYVLCPECLTQAYGREIIVSDFQGRKVVSVSGGEHV